jgi:hypothetical protein
MARLKRIMQSALEDRSVRFLLSTIALAVAVSLVAGFAIGYRVEESRIKPAKKAATKPIRITPGRSGFTSAPDLTGAVYQSVKKGVLIVVKDKKAYRISLGRKTRIALAKSARASNITVGSRVLFQPSSASSTTATEVVVLPGTALIGVPVTKVVAGTSMTLKSLNGAGLAVTTTGVPVLQTGPGSVADIVKGDRVVVRYVKVGTGTKARNVALEVVLLPASSKFR